MAIPEHLQKKIAEAKASGGGNPIKDGEYLLVVKQIICEGLYKGTFLIPEFDVVVATKTHPSIEPNMEGTDCSCAWALDKSGPAGDAAASNAKQFFCALLGLPDGTPTPEVMKKASEYSGSKTDPDRHRARGMLVHVTTHRKAIKTGAQAGREGVFPRFTRVEAENAPELVAKRRVELDAARR